MVVFKLSGLKIYFKICIAQIESIGIEWFFCETFHQALLVKHFIDCVYKICIISGEWNVKLREYVESEQAESIFPIHF